MVFGIVEGSIQLVLDKNIFNPGEIVKGRIILKLNNPKKAKELRVNLLRVTTTMRKGKRHETSIKLSEAILGGEQEYSSKEYNFELLIPTDIYPNPINAPANMQGIVAGAASLISMFGVNSPPTFCVHAKLVTPLSFDMSKSVMINIVRPQQPPGMQGQI